MVNGVPLQNGRRLAHSRNRTYKREEKYDLQQAEQEQTAQGRQCIFQELFHTLLLLSDCNLIVIVLFFSMLVLYHCVL